jgi:hypothetical protein
MENLKNKLKTEKYTVDFYGNSHEEINEVTIFLTFEDDSVISAEAIITNKEISPEIRTYDHLEYADVVTEICVEECNYYDGEDHAIKDHEFCKLIENLIEEQI